MPQTWTDKKAILISNLLLDATSEQEEDTLRELALDYLNDTDAWVTSGDRIRCSFLGTDGHATTVTLGLSIVGEDAVVTYRSPAGNGLSLLAKPLKRTEEFGLDFVDEDYQSKPLVPRAIVKVRMGETRRLRPMKYEPDED